MFITEKEKRDSTEEASPRAYEGTLQIERRRFRSQPEGRLVKSFGSAEKGKVEPPGT